MKQQFASTSATRRSSFAGTDGRDRHPIACYAIIGMLLILSSFTTPITYSQSTASIPAYGTYEGNLDTINVGSLQVIINIPLYHIHARGDGNDKTISLVYNSALDHISYPDMFLPLAETGQSTPYVAMDSNSWSLQSVNGYGGRVIATGTHSDSLCGKSASGVKEYIEVYTYTFIDSRGVAHFFPNTSTTHSGCTGANTSVSNVSSDSGILLVSASAASATVRDASGVEYIAATQIWEAIDTDANGNSSSNLVYGPYYPARCFAQYFFTNNITIQNTGYYFSPNLSPATTKALIESNEELMTTGGWQGAKEKAFFGIVNAYQWYMGSWK